MAYRRLFKLCCVLVFTQNLYAVPLSIPQAESTPQKEQESAKKITQEMRDLEASRLFGKNRNGVLLGLSYIGMRVNYAEHNTFKGNLSMLGARLGYQRFINNGIFGVRAYVDSYAGIRHNDRLVLAQGVGAYNIDLLLDYAIPNTWCYVGVFGGVGYGFMEFRYALKDELGKVSKFHFDTGFYNLGIALSVGAKHRFELYSKIPMEKSFESRQYRYITSTLLSIAYQFTF